MLLSQELVSEIVQEALHSAGAMQLSDDYVATAAQVRMRMRAVLISENMCPSNQGKIDILCEK